MGRPKNHLQDQPVVEDNMFDFDWIKQLTLKCDIQELDGYMVNIWSDHDGTMQIQAKQFDKFCSLLLEDINKNATPGSSDVGIITDA